MDGKRLTASLENYLEVIYRIVRQKGVARVKEIAKALAVRMPSVNSALKALQERNLVEHSRYGYVELTPFGEEAARRVLRQHETLTEFLRELLGVEAAVAEEDACKIEHVISRDTFERVLAMVEFLQTCPEEDRAWLARFQRYRESGAGAAARAPAGAEGAGAVRSLFSLAHVPPGTRVVVHRLAGGGPLQQRMLDMGVVPGTPILVERVAPLGDPIEIKVRGYHLSLRREEAAKIKVAALKPQEDPSVDMAAEQGD